MKTITEEQFKKEFGEETYNQLGGVAQKKPGYFQRVGQGIKQAFTGLKTDLETQAQTIAEQEISEAPTLERVGKTALALGRSAIRGPAAVAQAAFTPVLEAPGIKQVTEFAGEKLAKTAPVQKFNEWAQRHPEAAKDIMNTLDIGTLFGGKVAIAPLGKVTSTTAKAVTKTFEETAETISKKVATPVTKLKSITAPIVEEAKRLPSRIQTNVAQKQAVQESISKLPTKVAQEAAQDGIEIADIKALYNISKVQKAPLKKLATVVKYFAEGKTKTKPI